MYNSLSRNMLGIQAEVVRRSLQKHSTGVKELDSTKHISNSQYIVDTSILHQTYTSSYID